MAPQPTRGRRTGGTGIWLATAPRMTEAIAAYAAWTCPFCSLLCDGYGLSDATSLSLEGSDCPRARAALDLHRDRSPDATPRIDGTPASLADAIVAAAQRMDRWRQPLFGGLGVDIHGARALYRLAVRTRAICDAADGAALMHGLRALQDRGQYQTTLGEIASRADLLVCVGTPAVEHYPEFFRRCGLGAAGSPCTGLVFLGVPAPARLPAGVHAQALPGSGDLYADVQQLAALVARRRVPGADPALAALAGRLHEARYAVLVWEAGALPAHGALLVEALGRIVATLNGTTRAATFPLGGSDGASSVNQVFAWLSGLPLRSRAGPLGAEHEPQRFGADRLLADGSVDGLLWISSFDPTRTPPPVDLPRIVLGPAAMASRLQEAGGIFVPVATPGLNAGGHLLRTDGTVVVPLPAVRDDGLPGVDVVLQGLADALESRT